MKAALLALLLLPTARPTHELIIYKNARKMEFRVNGQLVRRFVVSLGGAPRGDKKRQGDSKTPEGEFYVAWKNPGSKFHRFLGLSYPMPRHAQAGLKAGLITQKTARRIRSAARKRRKPPQYSRLGGLVGVHGGGGGWWDWTLGCIAISDDEIEWLYKRMRVGDRIFVRP